MNLDHYIKELRAARDLTEQAITALERLAGVKRMGRPPKRRDRPNLDYSISLPPEVRPMRIIHEREPRSVKSRAAQSRKMKAYWALRKKKLTVIKKKGAA